MTSHVPVLIDEMLNYLQPNTGEKFLDCTFGGGSYSQKILDSCQCSVVAIDRDPNVQKFASKLCDKYGNRFELIITDYASANNSLSNLKFDGIVMDLGVSSMQLDEPERGFSFMLDGPLDMRMSHQGESAEDFINNASQEYIADIIYRYGDEISSRQIAKKIVSQRQLQPIRTTHQLAQIVREAIGFRKSKIDLATKTFQAIRIYINDELMQLEKFLANVRTLLAPKGRIVIVSFHSLEDRIVKNFFKDNSQKIVAKSKYSEPKQEISDHNKWLRILTKKPHVPTDIQIKNNPRSRSSKLRSAISIEKAIGGN